MHQPTKSKLLIASLKVRDTYAVEVVAEWYTAIASKGPKQSRGGRHDTNSSGCQQYQYEGSHDCRSSFTVCRLHKDFDERKPCRTVQRIINISEAKEQCDLFSLNIGFGISETMKHTNRAKPIIPFNIIEEIMTQGTTVEAFWISSAITALAWTLPMEHWYSYTCGKRNQPLG